MKKSLLLLCALLLSACIDVEDFGDAWSKGTIDPALAGKWEKVATPDMPRGDIYRYNVTVKDGVYVITAYEGEIEKTDEPIQSKFLTAGPYNFFMSGPPPKGSLYRYKIADGVFQLYDLDTTAARQFVAEKYPAAQSIDTRSGGSVFGEIAFFSVKTLDKEALKILAEIPDNENYWKLDSAYKKTP